MLEQSENTELYKFIVEAAPNALILVNDRREIVFINKFAEDLFQYTKQEIAGKNIEVLVPKRHWAKHPDYVESYMREPVTRPMGAGRDLYAVKKDKSEFPAEIALNETQINGKKYILAVVLDITERKKSEKTIRESKARLDVFFQQSIEGFFFMMLDEPVYWDNTVDKEKVLDYVFEHQRITRINEAMLEQYGANKEDFIGLTPNDFFPHDMEHGREVWRKFFDSGKLHIDTQEQKLDGTPMIVFGDYVCMYDDKGRITGHFGIQREITKERQAENALKESEHKLKTVFEILDVGITITDEQGNIIDCNKASEKILGITKEQHLGRNYAGSQWQIISPDGSPMPPEEFASVKSLKEKKPVRNTEMGIIKSDNRITWIIVNAAPVNIKGYGVVITYFDITVQREYQNQLNEERQRLAGIVEGTNVGTWEWNVQTGETVFNQKWAEMIGYTLHELSPVSIDTWMKFAHPEDLKISGELLNKHFNKELDYYEFEGRMKHKKGAWIWVLDRGKVISWTKDGKPLLMMGTHQDITKRKQAQTEFETILSTTQDGFFITDAKANILEANEAFCQMLGYTRTEMLKLSIPDIEGSEKPEEVAAHMETIFTQGYDIFETKHKHKDNTLIDIEISVTLIELGIKKLIVFARDITERKKGEAAIMGAKGKLEKQNNQIKQSIQYAERIQFSILPQMADINKYLQFISIYFKPKDVIGGDFYWFHHAPNSCFIAAIDCTGHNVPGAMMTMTVHSLLNEIMIRNEHLTTGEILSNLHSMLYKFLQQDKGQNYSQDGCDISLCKLSRNNKTLQFSGAHQDLYLIKPDTYSIIKSTPKSIGGYSLIGEKEPHRTFKTENITIENDVIIAMTTDGVLDQLDEKDDIFGRNHFVSLIQNNYNSDCKLAEIFDQTMKKWTENTVRQDDFLTITFKLNY